MSDESLATCPVDRIGTIPDAISVVRSNSVMNSPEYFAAAHKLEDGLMRKLFSHGVAPDHAHTPQIVPIARDQSSIEDVVTYIRCPVVFQNWKE